MRRRAAAGTEVAEGAMLAMVTSLTPCDAPALTDWRGLQTGGEVGEAGRKAMEEVEAVSHSMAMKRPFLLHSSTISICRTLSLTEAPRRMVLPGFQACAGEPRREEEEEEEDGTPSCWNALATGGRD